MNTCYFFVHFLIDYRMWVRPFDKSILVFLHLQNAMHVTLYIIGRAFISSSSKKPMYTKMSSVHGSSVLTVKQ